MKEYKYLNQYEINKLRQDLMIINNDLFSDTLSTKISTIVKDIINQGKGDKLEENLRNIFTYEFGWKASDIPREFSYKKINVNGLPHIICKFRMLSFVAKGQTFFLKYNDRNYSCEIYKNQFKSQLIKNKERRVKTKIGDYNIEIFPKNKIEVDGI